MKISGKEMERFWMDRPPEPSRRLLYWIGKIEDGWETNRRIGQMDYYSRSEFFGVYLWEYLHAILPLLEGKELRDDVKSWLVAEKGADSGGD